MEYAIRRGHHKGPGVLGLKLGVTCRASVDATTNNGSDDWPSLMPSERSLTDLLFELWHFPCRLIGGWGKFQGLST